MTAQTQAGQPDSFGVNRLKEIGNAVIDLFFPAYCVACHRHGAWLCSHCQAEIETIPLPVCHRCGLPLEGPAQPTPAAANCGICQDLPAIDGLRSWAYHDKLLRLAIHQLKYQELQALAAPLGQWMGQAWERLRPPALEIDAIVPVPLHTARLKERGYNQAALLAQALGAQLQCPVVEEVLIRTKATVPQVGLDAQDRQTNVSNAFRCKTDRLAGQRILLIDDVYTTGSTLAAAGQALRTQRVSSVWAYTLARAR